MLANIEFFIFLLIAGGSALFNWLQKRKEDAEEWQELPPPKPPVRTQQRGSAPPPPVSPPKQASNWEEELRRMLEGTVPTTRTPPPPPIVVQERRSPPPAQRQPESPRPAPAKPRPKPIEEKYYKAHCNHCGEHIEFPASATDEVTSCPHCHQLTVLRPFQDTRVEILSHQKDLSSFNSFTKKHDVPSEMSERVAAHMHGVGHKPVKMTAIEPSRKVWPEVAETRALFKNSKTVRQAMIASFILGPPKALEDSTIRVT